MTLPSSDELATGMNRVYKMRSSTRKNSSALSGPAAANFDDVQRISNAEVDNALLLGDFDAASSPIMGGRHDNIYDRNIAMPKMNLGASVGTRSPSPSDISDSSKSSGSYPNNKRKEFENNNEEDDDRVSPRKRAATPQGGTQIGDSPTVTVTIRMDREREGRCPDCGLETHTMVRKKDGNFERQPLNIDGEVLDGKCLFCNPHEDFNASFNSDTSSQKFVHNVKHAGVSPINSNHWPSGSRTPTRQPSKQAPIGLARNKSGKNIPFNVPQSNNNKIQMSPPSRLWHMRRRSLGEGESVSSLSAADGLDTVDSISEASDDRSLRSGASQKSTDMEKLGSAMSSGMGMNGGNETPRQQSLQRRVRSSNLHVPTSPYNKSNRSPIPQRSAIRKTTSADVQSAVAVAHSKLRSSIYHHHMYPLDSRAEQAFIEKTRVYLESGSGDICDVVVAMRRFPFSLSIQSVACEKLFVHCFEREHAQAIGLAGGIRTIIDAMEHHPSNVALHHTCVRMIKHLASAGPYNLNMLDRMGAVGIIMATMERHSRNAMLLESCCWTIEGMARAHSPDFKMRVAQGGGIHAAMKVIETFPDNESLLRAAFHCLRQLGYNPSLV